MASDLAETSICFFSFILVHGPQVRIHKSADVASLVHDLALKPGNDAMHDLHVCLYFAFMFGVSWGFPHWITKKKKEPPASEVGKVVPEKQLPWPNLKLFVYTTEWLLVLGFAKLN